jgi:SulP family sulfate permease
VRSPAHRAWTDFGLALVIMAAIVVQGYLAGIMFGVVAACLMFAVSYGRISVIRRHLTRSVVASNMDRSAPISRHLQEHGERIHLFWLSGYIFFGSSNGLYEKLVAEMGEGSKDAAPRFAILDFADVTGFDTSAVMSLKKLANYAETHGVTLVLAAPSQRMANALVRVGVVAREGIPSVFPSRNDALEWCEDQILTEGNTSERGSHGGFEDWLAAEVGGVDAARRLARYFERRDVRAGMVLYVQGSPSQSIDLILSGTVSVSVSSEGSAHVVRRMSTRTVIGEMGFFRGLPRGATIATDGAATLYTLSAERFLLLKTDDPEIAAAFLEFIVRTLSDRLAFANQGLAALN